jgi:hypothetical protein
MLLLEYSFDLENSMDFLLGIETHNRVTISNL